MYIKNAYPLGLETVEEIVEYLRRTWKIHGFRSQDWNDYDPNTGAISYRDDEIVLDGIWGVSCGKESHTTTRVTYLREDVVTEYACHCVPMAAGYNATAIRVRTEPYMPTLKVGDRVHVRGEREKREYGTIVNVTEDSVLVAFGHRWEDEYRFHPVKYAKTDIMSVETYTVQKIRAGSHSS